jgi:hypothetical protein
MRASRLSHAVFLTALGFFAACALGDDHKALPSCTQLEGQVVTLRGKVSKVWDNMPPDADFGEELVLDPMETVLLLTLSRPLCGAPENSKQNRPVVQPEVTIVEIVPSGDAIADELQSSIGKTRTITGTLSENVWWRYKATMQIAVTSLR